MNEILGLGYHHFTTYWVDCGIIIGYLPRVLIGNRRQLVICARIQELGSHPNTLSRVAFTDENRPLAYLYIEYKIPFKYSLPGRPVFIFGKSDHFHGCHFHIRFGGQPGRTIW